MFRDVSGGVTTAISTAPGPGLWAVNWRRLGRRAFIGGLVAIAAVQLRNSANSNEYGLDFLTGTWHAGQAVLAGLSPYPPLETGWRLLHASSGFFTPPLLALVGVPFALLPFTAGILVFNAVCIAGGWLALYLLGVTDRRVWILSLCSFPFVSSLVLGQPDALLALAAAVAWHWRDDRWRGAVAAGVLIAAKLLAWPLLLWLLVTGRRRQALVAAATASATVFASWAMIGFRGMGSYLRLLADNASAGEYHSHSLVSGFMRLGLTAHAALVGAVLIAIALSAGMVVLSQRSDGGWFTAAIVLGILSSPIVWDHYLVILVICLAAVRRVRDPLAWLLLAALWACPVENPANLWEAWFVPVVTAAIGLRIVYLSRPAHGWPGNPSRST